MHQRTIVPLQESFEYALVVLEGKLDVEGVALATGHLAYLRAGRSEVTIDGSTSTRVMLLGGAPLDEQILMWWNFVARTREEIEAAYRSWSLDDGRFGAVTSSCHGSRHGARSGGTPPRREANS